MTKSRSRASTAASLVVAEGERAWTEDELAHVCSALDDDLERLTEELHAAEREFAYLVSDSGDGAGFDHADVGSSTMERDQEMSVANNARDMLVQVEHAKQRIEDGSYGVCESCGQPIGKQRLIAYPRATLCLPCKQREERR